MRPTTGGAFETDSFSLPIAARTAACAVTLTVEKLVLGASTAWLTGQ